MTMKSKKKVMSSLQKSYSELPDKKKIAIRERVKTRCGISTKTFYRWMADPEKIRRPDRLLIAKTFQKPVEELFQS